MSKTKDHKNLKAIHNAAAEQSFRRQDVKDQRS